MSKIRGKVANIQIKSYFLGIVAAFKICIKNFYNKFHALPAKNDRHKEIGVEEILQKFFS